MPTHTYSHAFFGDDDDDNNDNNERRWFCGGMENIYHIQKLFVLVETFPGMVTGNRNSLSCVNAGKYGCNHSIWLF